MLTHSEAEAHFRQMARPSRNDRLEEASRDLRGCTDRRADDRTRQFNVTLADRPQLDALANALDLPRSKVINLALSELAQTMERFDDEYVQLFVKYGKRLFDWLICMKGCTRSEAKRAASRIADEHFMTRKEWREVLKKDFPIRRPAQISGKELIEGKPGTPARMISREEYVEGQFRGPYERFKSGSHRNPMWRYLDETM
jgi:hypothetical protein